MHRIKNIILTAASLFAFFLYGFFGLLLYPYFFITGFRPSEVRYFFYLLAKMVMWFVRMSSTSFNVFEQEPLPPGAAVVTANHCSMLDALVFSCLNMHEIIFIVKDWPFKIPFFRDYAKGMGNIRANENSFEDIAAQAGKAFGQGLKLVVFPEGTRYPEGAPGRFHSGAFWLARQFSVPVIPVGIKGLGSTMPKNTIILQSSAISITRYKHIDAARLGAATPLETAKQVRKIINDTHP